MKRIILLLAPIALCGVTHAQVMSGSAPNTGYANFYAWYDASEGVNGPGQPADGDAVATWEDQTPNGRHLVRVNTDPARQPTFRSTGANGHPAVEFDGDDYIWADGAAEFGTMTTGKTILFVVEVDSLNNTGYVFDSTSGSGRNAVITGQSALPDTWQIYTGTGIAVNPLLPPMSHDIFEVHSVVIDNGNQEHWLDGTSLYSDVLTMQDMKGLLLGARYSTANGLTGHIAEFMVYDEVLAAADRQALEGYLDAKYFGPALPSLSATGVAGTVMTFDFANFTPASVIAVVYGPAGSTTGSTGCGTVTVDLVPLNFPPSSALILLTADGAGSAQLVQAVPAAGAGLLVQGVGLSVCEVCNTITIN